MTRMERDSIDVRLVYGQARDDLARGFRKALAKRKMKAVELSRAMAKGRLGARNGAAVRLVEEDSGLTLATIAKAATVLGVKVRIGFTQPVLRSK